MQMGGRDVGSLDDLLSLMTATLERFDRERDHRAAFLRVYRGMSRMARERLSGSFFLDPAWVERVAVRFAWYYFDALERFGRGDCPPPAWEVAFRMAEGRQGFLMQDILLGMNAHINNDLPLVVAGILRDEQDESALFRMIRRRFDHDQINRVLHDVIPSVEAEIARSYGRLVRPLSRVVGSLDQSLTTFGLKTWRDKVWRNARFLLAASGEGERRQVIHFIQQDALQVAREIEHFPFLRWCRPLAPLMRRWRL